MDTSIDIPRIITGQSSGVILDVGPNVTTLGAESIVGKTMISSLPVCELRGAENVTELGTSALTIGDLRQLTLWRKLTNIGVNALGGGQNLETILLLSQNLQINTNQIFRELCKSHDTTLIVGEGVKRFPRGFSHTGSHTLKIRFEEGCEAIAQSALMTQDSEEFRGRVQIENWPKSLRIIEKDAFWQTNLVTCPPLPEGLTTIGQSAFFGSTISSIVFPSTLTDAGNDSFVSVTMPFDATFLSLTPPQGAPFGGNNITDRQVTVRVIYGCAGEYKNTSAYTQQGISLIEITNLGLRPYIKDEDGKWKVGVAYIKTNDGWRKGSKVYIKQPSEINTNTNFWVGPQK